MRLSYIHDKRFASRVKNEHWVNLQTGTAIRITLVKGILVLPTVLWLHLQTIFWSTAYMTDCRDLGRSSLWSYRNWRSGSLPFPYSRNMQATCTKSQDYPPSPSSNGGTALPRVQIVFAKAPAINFETIGCDGLHCTPDKNHLNTIPYPDESCRC